MTAQNQKRAPILLGPNWQGSSRARESAPPPPQQAPSFHASLRECGLEPEPQPEARIQKSPAIQQSGNKPAQLHLILLKHIGAWLNAQSANKKQQAARAAAQEDNAPRLSAPIRQHSSALLRLWSWLHAKYATSSTKRLRVAEMVALGEKRFLAVVCVEGREFLVGGGASGVSVVTQLDAARNTAHVLRSELEFQGAIE